MRKCFVLGAPDPEMAEIERVVRAAGHVVCFALNNGKRCRPENAYNATGVTKGIRKGSFVVFVECEVLGMAPDVIVDHHREGDPGYGKGPSEYFEASSLGQVLCVLEQEPTATQRIIAAADHCPDKAYRGLCPGVEPEALAAWRTADRASRRMVSIEEMNRGIEEARVYLEHAEKINFAGQVIAWVGDYQGEVTEASARYGIPFMYSSKLGNGDTKFGLMNADADVLRAWMAECGLERVYGDPVRGYAGGYMLAES